MKFINTITWTLINLEDIYKISCEDFQDLYHSYFYLRNGEKHEVYDNPVAFELEGKTYEFCSFCHNVINRIVMSEIMEMDNNKIFDISFFEDQVWTIFMIYIRKKIDELTETR